MITTSVASIFFATVLFAGPIITSSWENNNQGKLFKHIEADVLKKRREKKTNMQTNERNITAHICTPE